MTETLTSYHLGVINDLSGNILNVLDENSLRELTGGYENDLESFFDILHDECKNVLTGLPIPVQSDSYFNLEYLPSSMDEALKLYSYNYFKTVVLTDFDMNWYNIEWGQMAQLYQYLGILAARGHGKSHEWTFAYPLWNLYRYERSTHLNKVPLDLQLSKEGMIVTNEYGLGKKLLKKIVDEIKSNEMLSDKLNPELRSDGSLGKESIETKSGSLIELRSSGSSIRGPHPGWIVFDDFLDKSVIYSADQRSKFREVFYSEAMNAILPQGSVK